MWSVVGLLMFASSAALAQTASKIVNIEQGPVRGYLEPEGGLYSFLNIPYATAPTGVNKYKAPLPPPTWTEPFESRDKRIACPQSFPNPNVAALLDVQDDCLITNVYIPDTNATNLPVLVAIHGRGYQVGFSTLLTYNGLVRSQRLIVVTLNYRVGIAGFLCLGTEDIPGNAGMKDQVALLRWVNKNIESFGGNPNDVTVYGCSAGGSSVDFLTLSPMTDGLFKKGIPTSGTFFGSVGPQVDPIENAKMYAKQLNFTNVNNITALEEFYKTASYEILFSAAEYIMIRDDTLFLFTPCVERDTGVERFLDDTPENIINKGKYHQMPLLYGFTEMEGLFHVNYFDEYKDRMNVKFSDFLPAELQFENEAQREEVGNKVRRYYFGNANVTTQNILSYVNYFSDIMYAYPMLRSAHLRRTSRNDQIYLYEYSFVDENTQYVPHTTVKGARHCEQMYIVADNHRGMTDNFNLTDDFNAMRVNMREMWLNFITSGNPTPPGSNFTTWLPLNSSGLPYMELKAPMELQLTSLLGDRLRFWDEIYEDYYRAPVPPVHPTDPPGEPDSASAPSTSFIFLFAVLVINYMV